MTDVPEEWVEKAARAMVHLRWPTTEPIVAGDREVARAVLEAVLPDVQAQALCDAADAWLHGGWGDTPRRADRVADRMAASQYAGDWLLARAHRLDDNGGSASPTDRDG